MTYDESKIRLHRVVGAIFTDMPPPAGKGEAVPVEELVELHTVKVAYRVKEESAIPLALPGQIVLGGEELTVAQLDNLQGALVAATFEDGACLFKRLGARLPGRSAHLLQLESIGGLGSSVVVATEVSEQAHDVPTIASVRRVVGVLYRMKSHLGNGRILRLKTRRDNWLKATRVPPRRARRAACRNCLLLSRTRRESPLSVPSSSYRALQLPATRGRRTGAPPSACNALCVGDLGGRGSPE